MYIDVCEECVDLSFQLGQAGVGTSIANRQWSIKVLNDTNELLWMDRIGMVFYTFPLCQVTQYDCCYDNLAPAGCTQYFYGSSSQTVKVGASSANDWKGSPSRNCGGNKYFVLCLF